MIVTSPFRMRVRQYIYEIRYRLLDAVSAVCSREIPNQRMTKRKQISATTYVPLPVQKNIDYLTEPGKLFVLSRAPLTLLMLSRTLRI
jgi:hypothetical protein